MLHWVLPLANCVTEHACLFFAGHAYTSKVAFPSLFLQMSFLHRVAWKIYFCSEPLPWLWLSCALALAWPSPFHQPLCTCTGFLAAIVPFCTASREQGGSHPWAWLVQEGCCTSALLRRDSEGLSRAEGEIHFNTSQAGVFV